MTFPKKQMDPLISSIDSNEILNTTSHFIGALLSLILLIFLIQYTSKFNNPILLISFSIYGITLFMCFLASSIMHFFLIFNKYSRTLGIIDHCAIYLLLVGGYTPIFIIGLPDYFGYTYLYIFWTLAVISILLKIIFFQKMSIFLSIINYLIMALPLGFIIYPLYVKFGYYAISLMLAAIIILIAGLYAYIFGKPNPKPPLFGNHEIWHLSVVLSNSLFCFVVINFILP